MRQVYFKKLEPGLYESAEQHGNEPRFTITRIEGYEVVDVAQGDSRFVYRLSDAKTWAREQPYVRYEE